MAGIDIGDTGVAIERPVTTPQNTAYRSIFGALGSRQSGSTKGPTGEEKFGAAWRAFWKEKGAIDPRSDSAAFKQGVVEFNTMYPEYSDSAAKHVDDTWGIKVLSPQTSMEEGRRQADLAADKAFRATPEGQMVLASAAQAATDPDTKTVDENLMAAAYEQGKAQYFADEALKTRSARSTDLYWKKSKPAYARSVNTQVATLRALADEVLSEGTTQTPPEFVAMFGETLEINELLAIGQTMRDTARIMFAEDGRSKSSDIDDFDNDWEADVFKPFDNYLKQLREDPAGAQALLKYLEASDQLELYALFDENGLSGFHQAWTTAQKAGPEAVSALLSVEGNREQLKKYFEVMGRLGAEEDPKKVIGALPEEEKEILSTESARNIKDGTVSNTIVRTFVESRKGASGPMGVGTFLKVFGGKSQQTALKKVLAEDPELRDDFILWAAGDLRNHAANVKVQIEDILRAEGGVVSFNEDGTLHLTQDTSNLTERELEVLKKREGRISLKYPEGKPSPTTDIHPSSAWGEAQDLVVAFNKKALLLQSAYEDVGEDVKDAFNVLEGNTEERATWLPNDVRVDKEFLSAVDRVAGKYNMDPEFLLGVIKFETSGSFSPIASNPNSSATGLIQFMDKTAKGLGTTTAELAEMPRTEQMEWVDKYFATTPLKGMKDPQLSDVYMAVLWPAAVGKPDSTVLWRASDGPKSPYHVNNVLDLDGDGTVTKGEATNAVRQRMGQHIGPASGQSVKEADPRGDQAITPTRIDPTPEVSLLDAFRRGDTKTQADVLPPPGMTGSPPKGFHPMLEEDPAWVAKHALPPSPEGENYGGQDSPWPIAWSDERTDDEKLFNSLPNGAWFIDPDGIKRKKLRDIPVEGN